MADVSRPTGLSLRAVGMQQRNIIAIWLGALNMGDWSILFISLIIIGLLAVIR